MIKLKNRLLNETDLVGVLNHLKNQNGLSPKVAWNVMRICKKIDGCLRDNREIFQKMLKKHAILNDKGLPAERVRKDPEGKETALPGTWTIKDESKELWEKEFEEFLDIETEIDRSHFRLEDLVSAQLSPAQLEALEPLIVEMSLV